jgi:hypothetical protein
MFVAFMPLHILLCDEVLPYFILCVKVFHTLNLNLNQKNLNQKNLKWWRWLIPSRHVVLKFAKNRILGVDTPGQHVPPRVRYGTTYLLIRNVIGCVSCSVEWGWHHTL